MQILGGKHIPAPPIHKKSIRRRKCLSFPLYCDVPEMPLLDPHLEEVRRPVVVSPLCLYGLDHDPCYGHAPALPLLDGLLHGGQAAVVLRTVLTLVLVQRVAVPGEVGAGPRAQGRDVDAVDGPGVEMRFLFFIVFFSIEPPLAAPFAVRRKKGGGKGGKPIISPPFIFRCTVYTIVSP